MKNMANIKFLIRDMDAGNEQTIYITSRFGRNEKLMYATPLKIEPLFWDEKKNVLKTQSIVPIRTRLMQLLKVLKEK